tara:strand:+ start:11143 stop:11727 length:585 start_codon:yes stop_codon:yes gene_type:complete
MPQSPTTEPFDDDMDLDIEVELTPAQKGAATKRAKAELKKEQEAESADARAVGLNAEQKKELGRKVDDAVDSFLNEKDTLTQGQKDYAKNGGRRWRCKVESTRKGVQHFEMIVADPRNPKRPIPVRGRCGMIIEEGLPKFVLDNLRAEYRTETQEVPQDPTKLSGFLHKQVRIPNYTVEIFEEIENPKAIGTVK